MDRENVPESSLPKRDTEEGGGKKVNISISALIKYYNKAVEVGESTLILDGNEMDVSYSYYLITHNLNKLNLEGKYVFNNSTKLFEINE